MRGRLRPSPAMVVAFIALFVAIGGSSYAVTRLPAKSVGSKQLEGLQDYPRRDRGEGQEPVAHGADIKLASLAGVASAVTRHDATHATHGAAGRPRPGGLRQPAGVGRPGDARRGTGSADADDRRRLGGLPAGHVRRRRRCRRRRLHEHGRRRQLPAAGRPRLDRASGQQRHRRRRTASPSPPLRARDRGRLSPRRGAGRSSPGRPARFCAAGPTRSPAGPRTGRSVQRARSGVKFRALRPKDWP